MNVFIDREEELRALRGRLESLGLELVVIYGRRRIGKTALILNALHGLTDKRYIYYQAVETGNIRYFKKIAEQVEPRIRHAAMDWEAILSFLSGYIIVFDEFPYIVQEDPGFLSKLQRIIDHDLSDTQTKIVLLASSISLTRAHALDYGSPLHGRITSRLRVGPLKYPATRGFHPSLTWIQLAEIYGFAGGIPLYHKRIGDSGLWIWLSKELSKPDTWIIDETDIILRSEFRETRVYRGILEAIAYGKVSRKEISDYLDIPGYKLSPYLQKLEETGIIEKIWPLTEKPISKHTRYIIKDYFLAFWHRYIMPYRSLIVEGSYTADDIKADYNNYMGVVFEGIARQLLSILNKKGRLPIRYARAGTWWYRDQEVDILLVNDSSREAMLIETKWSSVNTKEQYRILYKLIDTAYNIPKIRNYKKYYGLIAREASDNGPPELWRLKLSDLNKLIPT